MYAINEKVKNEKHLFYISYLLWIEAQWKENCKAAKNSKSDIVNPEDFYMKALA